MVLKSWGFEKILKAILENNSSLTIIELSNPFRSLLSSVSITNICYHHLLVSVVFM